MRKQRFNAKTRRRKEFNILLLFFATLRLCVENQKGVLDV